MRWLDATFLDLKGRGTRGAGDPRVRARTERLNDGEIVGPTNGREDGEGTMDKLPVAPGKGCQCDGTEPSAEARSGRLYLSDPSGIEVKPVGLAKAERGMCEPVRGVFAEGVHVGWRLTPAHDLQREASELF